jgi:adenine-specific DNA-methyltransferase
VNLIYIDPPFNTDSDFSFTATIPRHGGDEDDPSTAFLKGPSILEQKAYRDTWGRGLDSYLEWFYETVLLAHELLCDNGSIYVHLDWHIGHYAKVVLDEVLGQDSCQNEIIWKRTSARSDSHTYNHIHDVIYFYVRGEFDFNDVYVPHDEQYISDKYVHVGAQGRRYRLDNITSPNPRPNMTYVWRGHKPPALGWRYSKETMQRLHDEGRIWYPDSKDKRPQLIRYLDESSGQPATSIWTDISPVNSQAAERLNYDTQKPEALLERIIRASSKEGDLVFDCFIGSGTTAAVAEKLNRRWIACDLSRFAIHTTRKRLLGIPDVRPFAVQNLGKYERQVWQAAEFPANGKDLLEEQRQREGAYRRFILDLYHATPITGHAWLHGTKAGRMVHVAAVDAPVTQADVKAIARDTWKAIGAVKGAPTKAAVDILGWEFALELNEMAKQAAAESRVDVSFKKIPREVLDKKAVEQGDVKFFELGALSVDLKQKGRSVSLKLSDFVIPTDDIPEEARKAIKHWSQLVDYWAVDWDFKEDTFHNQWQAYRTRKDPKIELATGYEYKESAKYQIVVKVIDILGNDTTKRLEITVK